MNSPLELRLQSLLALNASVQPTGSFLVPLDYGSGVYACHLNLAEATAHGGSLNSPNFNLAPQMDSSPITWNSNSDSGPTTSTVSTSISAPALVHTSVVRTTVTTGVPVSSSVVVRYATSTRISSPSPSSTSSPSQSSHPSIGAIVGGSIAGVIGVAFLAVAIILCFRRRFRGRKEISQPSRGTRADQYVTNQMRPELGGLGAVVEADGQQHHNRELHGYPVAVGHCVPVRELEGRAKPPL